MNSKQSIGILLPIFSLPDGDGIGDFQAGIKFLKHLKENNYAYWQILPIGPVDPEHYYSPYTTFSSFALNPLFIPTNKNTSSNRVNYLEVYKNKMSDLKKEFHKFKETLTYQKFCQKQWLSDYALFMACLEYFQKPWYQWPDELVKREKNALHKWTKKLKEQINFHKFLQYLAYQSWNKLRKIAQNLNIKIIGDLPMFVAHNSADVWVAQDEFQLEQNGLMSVVAGVPPDYFNPEGQVWNLPLYNWEKMQTNNFSWWITRIRNTLELFDLVRLDHFRGFEACFAIPAKGKAKEGQWQKSPGEKLFQTIKKNFPKMPFLAEDLGVITPEVDKLRDEFQLPSTKVGIIPFLDYHTEREVQSQRYWPENYPENSVVYSTTHDFNTIIGWYQDEATTEQREFFMKTIGAKNEQDIPKKFRDFLCKSKAKLIILSWQDVYGLGSFARINHPGIASKNNWTWRISSI